MIKKIIKLIGIVLTIFFINLLIAFVLVEFVDLSLLEYILDYCIVIAMVIVDYIILKKAYYDKLKAMILGIFCMFIVNLIFMFISSIFVKGDDGFAIAIIFEYNLAAQIILIVITVIGSIYLKVKNK